MDLDALLDNTDNSSKIMFGVKVPKESVSILQRGRHHSILQRGLHHFQTSCTVTFKDLLQTSGVRCDGFDSCGKNNIPCVTIVLILQILPMF